MAGSNPGRPVAGPSFLPEPQPFFQKKPEPQGSNCRTLSGNTIAFHYSACHPEQKTETFNFGPRNSTVSAESAGWSA